MQLAGAESREEDRGFQGDQDLEASGTVDDTSELLLDAVDGVA